MTDHIKLGSDRPDLELTLRDEYDRPADLSDATGVHIDVWVGTDHLVDDDAFIEVGRLGLVTYDFDRGQIDTAGDALIEIRVDWANGDEQWFPIDRRGFEMEIVPPPGPRGSQPTFGHDILVIGDTETHVVDGNEVYTRVENGGEMHTGPGDESRL